jgi:hypothetical protein
MFKCPICGNDYNTIDGVQNCLNKCGEKEKLKQFEMAKESVMLAYEQLKKAIAEYNEKDNINQYISTLTYKRKEDEDSAILKPIKLRPKKETFSFDINEEDIKNLFEKNTNRKKDTVDKAEKSMEKLKNIATNAKTDSERKYYNKLIDEFADSYSQLNSREKEFFDVLIDTLF